MIFGQKMTIIIITIIKHHNSKYYIYGIFIKTDDNRLCLFKKYRFIISRVLTKHFRLELFDESVLSARSFLDSLEGMVFNRLVVLCPIP